MNAIAGAENIGVVCNLLTGAILGGRSKAELYALLKMDGEVNINNFNKVIAVGAKMGLWSVQGEWLRITSKGSDYAERAGNIVRIMKALEEPHEQTT